MEGIGKMGLNDYQDGENLQLACLIKDAQAKTTKTNSQYLALTFSDQSGELSGNLWDATAEQVAAFQPGVVVELTGKRSSYQGRPQVEIQALALAPEKRPEDFVPQAPESVADMKDALRPFFTAIQEPTWHQIVVALVAQHGEKFFTSPAAKTNHHAFAGGLAYHTLSILRLAEAVCDLYPALNRELLYAGAILHDLGKTLELSGAVATRYTLAGQLVGHISLLDGEIVATCQAQQLDPNSEAVVLLRHLILSHHGLLEYGSPVRPQVREAEVLHQLDELDASLLMMDTALAKTTPGEFTDRLFAMDRRQFYRPQE